MLVFIVCDTGERYLSKAHNIEWLKENRMLDVKIKILRDVSDRKKIRGIEDIGYVHDDFTVKEAMKIINEKGYSQLPVFDEHLKPVGCISEVKINKN